MKFSISPRLTLVIIAAMFLLPLILAWLMYTETLEFEPGSTRNLGTLIEPPLPLDWNDLQRIGSDNVGSTVTEILQEHWVILYPIAAECGLDCQKQVASLRQIHLAAGRHQSRVRLALLLETGRAPDLDQLLISIYEKFNLITDPSGTLTASLASTQTPGTRVRASTYLIDPLGNIMMYYTADADPNDLKADLKRLLTWSKLDEQ